MTETGEATALHELTAGQAARLIRSGELSPVELTEHLLARADQHDERVRAWVSLDRERALLAARLAEHTVRNGTAPPPLLGVPFGAKNIFDSAGLATSSGFAPFAHRVPPADCEAIARLKHAGA